MYSKERHDFGILRQDGTTQVGFILAERKGVPQWASVDDDYMAQQQTQVPGYEALPPEKEINLISDDWRSGFGLETFDISDPKRYYESFGMDMRSRGRALLSNGATTITKPTNANSTPTISNADFESDSDWTQGAATTSRDATHVRGGSWAWKVLAAGSAAWAYQDQTEKTYCRGATYTLKCWVWCSQAAKATIQLGDQVSAAHSGNSTFQQLSINYTVPLTATSLRIRINCDTAQVAWFDDITIETTSVTTNVGTTVAFVEFNDELYASFGKLLGRLNTRGDSFYAAALLAAVITDLEPYSDDKLYIAQGTGAAYYEMNASEVITINTLANNQMKFLQQVHTTADTMYGTDGDNTIRSTTDPADGGVAWSGQTVVGTSAKAFTDLWSYQSALYMFKEDRPYYLDSSGNVKILTNITRPLSRVDGGKNSIEWNGNLYMPWGDDGLLEFDVDGNFAWLNPSKHCTNLPAFSGQVKALGGDEEWLHTITESTETGISLDGTANSEVDCGVIHDSAAKLWISIWFKFDSEWDAFTGTSPLLFGKENNIGDVITLQFDTTTGRLLFQKDGVGIQLYSSETSWEANRWYHIIASISSAEGMRLVIDNGTAVTNADVSAGPASGDFVLGNFQTASAGGFVGSIRNVTVGTDDLTSAEELNLFKGVLPGDEVNFWALDEGTGTTITDDGTGSNDATLGSEVTWLNKVEVLSGRYETIDGSTLWVWHPIQEITLAGCETVYVSNVYQKRLWISSTNSSDSLYYIPLPQGYGNIDSDANRDFLTGGYFTTPWLHANFKGDSKSFIKLILNMSHEYDAAKYFTVSYQVFGGAYVSIGNFAGSATSMTETKFLPSTPVTSTFIRLKFVGVTDSTTITPILDDFSLKGILYPPNRRIIRAIVRSADDIKLNDGTYERDNNAANIKTVLEEARDATWPVTFYDYKDGTLKYARFLPMTSEVVVDEKSRNPERQYTVYMQEVSLS